MSFILNFLCTICFVIFQINWFYSQFVSHIILQKIYIKLIIFIYMFYAVLWIRIRMDPELLPGSGSGIKDPDPAKSERAYK